MTLSIVDFEIDFADCDPFGIVFYPQFFRMMNTGVHKLFDNAGMPFHEVPPKYGILGVPLLETQAKFSGPARFGDRVRLESGVLEWREKAFIVRHVMRNANGDVLFEATETRGWVGEDKTAPKGLRAMAIPAEIKERIGTVPAAPSVNGDSHQ